MTSTTAIQAVAIDIDDTLVLTEATCFNLENDVLRLIGREPMSRGIHRSTWGRPLLDAMKDRSPGIDIGDFASVYQQVMSEYISEGRLDAIPEDNLKTLDRLAQSGRQLMLLTSRSEQEVAHFLAPDHPLAARIGAIYHSGNMRYRKPSPFAFDELLTDHRLLPSQCVYVGDSPSDAAAAKGAGLYFIACLQGGLRSSVDFSDYDVDAFIETFPDLLHAIDHLMGSGGCRVLTLPKCRS